MSYKSDHATADTEPARKFVSSVAFLSVVVGVLVIVGWIFNIAVLKSILPEWFPMKANFAIGLILIGTALLLTDYPVAAFNRQGAVIFSRRLARFCVLLAGLVGTLTLCEYILGWNLGIDQLLFREPVGAVGTTHPGRMVPEAALGLVLLATALLIASGTRKGTSWAVRTSVSLGLFVATLGLVAALSHLTPGLGTYGWFGLSIMAIHASAMLVMLGLAIIAISWQPDVMQWSLSFRTTAAFTIGMIVLVFIGFNTSRSQFLMKETNRQLTYDEELYNDVENLLIEVIDAQAHIRGYIITGEEQFLNHSLEAMTASNAKLDSLRKTISNNPHKQQQLVPIQASISAELQWLQQVIDVKQTGMSNTDRNKMVVHGESLLDNLRTTLEQFKSAEQLSVELLKQKLENVSQISAATIAVGSLSSLLIFIIVIFRFNSASNETKSAEAEIKSLLKNSLADKHKIELIMNSIVEGIYGVDLDGHVTFINPSAAQMFGYNTEELIGKLQHQILHHHRVDGTPYLLEECLIYRAFKENRVFHVSDEVFWKKDGTCFPVEYISGPIVENEKVVGAVVSFKDITESKRQEAEYHTLIQTSIDGFCIADLSGRILDVNEAYCRMLGYTREEFLRLQIRDFEASESPEETAEHLRKLTSIGGDLFQTRQRRKDGTVIDVEASIQYVAELGERIFSFIRDITERKRAEKEIQESHNKLVQSEKINAIGMMVASVAHELNNPLMSVSNLTDYCITNTDSSSKLFKVMAMIKSEADRCSEVIKNLLSFSRSEKEGDESAVAENCIVLSDRVLLLLRYRILSLKIDVKTEADKDFPAIEMKPQKIQQVIFNLVVNALDELETVNERPRELKLKFTSDENNISISVIDNGHGMSAEIQKKIFTPFFTTKIVAKGTGLGLAITKQIIDEHNGEITVTSELNKGSNFTITTGPLECSK